ncbi:MAG: bifunctional 2',3'-cyclic nucleotide 2'-phosphodiesterase/3'-nucleotidase precursor protein [Methanosaeta sp. PtaU1.Bin112]|nr:MAG: bifunctional 2',3'-cyclic nucleotide 2'-phosphodiesterase/3'-nucleotidase precursor protein [Methanosaeta sp. PtaU1.Bin112]
MINLSIFKAVRNFQENTLVGFYMLTIISILLGAFPAHCMPINSTEETVELQILAFNDFHGQLEPPSGSEILYYNASSDPFKAELGGAAYLATLIKGLKATNPNTVIVSAGDCIGASPLVSALFHDEATAEVLSKIGLEYSAAGNHEFDEGVSELQRMQYGCCHQIDGCQDGDRFVGAGYYYLTANVVNNSTNSTLFAPYMTREIEGIPISFIGVSLKDTPTVVTPSGVKGYSFLDEADSINATVKKLKEMGIKTIVVLIHNGGKQDGLASESLNLSGPIIDIVKRSDKEVDVFVTGHTHEAYVSNLDGRIVTQAKSQGKFITDIDLVISKDTGDVIQARAKNVAVTRDVPKDPDISEIIEKYLAIEESLAQEIIGSVTGDISRNQISSGESALGDLVSDSQLYSAKEEGAVVAFMNPGGIRTDLFYKESGSEGAGNVTYSEAFSVQPFDNSIYALNLTGSQIDELLEEQFDNPDVGRNRILQVSSGFSYAWNKSAPTGQKVNISSIMINGKAIDPKGSYRVAANGFLADGGDGFPVLKAGVDRICVISDIDAFVEYLQRFSPLSPGQMDRIAVSG